MSGLKVAEWNRYGHHRLYVKTESGEDVGWVDLTTSTYALDREDLRSEFESALREHGVGYLSDGGRVLVTTDRRVCRPTVTADPIGLHQWDHQSEGPTTADQPEQPWTDLSLNKPGQGVRSLAKSHRNAAPVRTAVARLLHVHTGERAYRVGADGEEVTGKQLAHLPTGWHALHAIPVGCHGSDIDHVVIGPGGVFTVNTKHHPNSSVWVAGDTFLVNGVRQPYVRNSRFEAKRTERLLSASRRLPRPDHRCHRRGGCDQRLQGEGATPRRSRPRGHPRLAARWLTERPVRLDASEVASLYEYARRSTTWT